MLPSIEIHMLSVHAHAIVVIANLALNGISGMLLLKETLYNADCYIIHKLWSIHKGARNNLNDHKE